MHDRLHILNLEQLQDLAKSANVASDFKNKNDAVKALSEVSGASVLLAAIYPTSELFRLQDIDREGKAIEKEWAVLCLYAKMLCEREIVQVRRPLALS